MLTKAGIQRLRSLRDKKHREALGLFVVEGEKVVAELLAAQFPFVEIYVTPKWSAVVAALSAQPAARPARKPGTGEVKRATAERPVFREITAEDMERVSHFPAPSGVL